MTKVYRVTINENKIKIGGDTIEFCLGKEHDFKTLVWKPNNIYLKKESYINLERYDIVDLQLEDGNVIDINLVKSGLEKRLEISDARDIWFENWFKE
jgi:hypothetical protein